MELIKSTLKSGKKLKERLKELGYSVQEGRKESTGEVVYLCEKQTLPATIKVKGLGQQDKTTLRSEE